ncbi:MAG: transcriptional regulator [Candidatus Omnitrophica bacterium CG11_big_fil_rev_8_21_14_0_20_45_26]|uniref:Transcriptional regulator n=1 Tax=Candidatus Abzuiibacterium crystallinum TaxID=1974748 RepID=A0A2H0LSM7_9BACT|nr:MAG: transcriptional regulator [Candidatus Omnitrophica bacterium CG11_big_fil_rev_8_21_14_0_20_45_26]PIW63401.1 MAG: ArsR family transcriptional regulator [Candidatus Omnitrophica bacterium CG12_big_fil_rev_8_21_14_0_65_45_16]
MISPKKIQQAARVLKTIGHPDRLKIIEALKKNGEMSVSELMGALAMGQAPLSKHLAVMKRQHILKSKVHGNYRYYSILNANVVNVLKCMQRHGD